VVSSHRNRLRQRLAISLFVVGHLTLVLLVYGAALVAGGGFETTPFAPDERIGSPAPDRAMPAALAPRDDPPSIGVLHSAELDPPWRVGADGRVHVDDR